MHRDRGASLVEYALIAAACAAALATGTAALHDGVAAQFGHAVTTPTPTGWTPAPNQTPATDPGGYVPPVQEPCVATWTVDDDGDGEPDPEETTTATGVCD